MKHPATIFLDDIEAFIKRSGISAPRLGDEAVGDPRFVFDLRRGRMPSLDLVHRTNVLIASYDKRSK